MALSESNKVCRSYIFDAPFVNYSERDMSSGDQLAQPRCGERVELVIVRHAHDNPPVENRARPPIATTYSIQRNCARSRGVPVYRHPGRFASTLSNCPMCVPTISGVISKR